MQVINKLLWISVSKQQLTESIQTLYAPIEMKVSRVCGCLTAMKGMEFKIKTGSAQSVDSIKDVIGCLLPFAH